MAKGKLILSEAFRKWSCKHWLHFCQEKKKIILRIIWTKCLCVSNRPSWLWCHMHPCLIYIKMNCTSLSFNAPGRRVKKKVCMYLVKAIMLFGPEGNQSAVSSENCACCAEQLRMWWDHSLSNSLDIMATLSFSIWGKKFPIRPSRAECVYRQHTNI